MPMMSFYKLHGLPGYVHPSFCPNLTHVVILQSDHKNPIEYTSMTKEDLELLQANQFAKIYAVTKMDGYQPGRGMYDPENKFV